jgi:HEAT repeat protein
MAESSIFESAFTLLQKAAAAGPGVEPPEFPLSWLSDLGTDQIRRLARLWNRLPVLLRRDLMGRMEEQARDNFELDFIAVARHALTDDDAEVRGHAVRALWECEDVQLVDQFLRMMTSDPDALVQVCAAEAIGPFLDRAEMEERHADLGSRMVRELIRITRGKGRPELRAKSVESIGYSSHAEVPGVLRAAYRDPDERLRISAITAMGRMADPDWGEVILPELKSRSAGMRAAAAESAGQLGLREAVPILAELLEDPESDVRLRAIRALGEIGGSAAHKALILLQHRTANGAELERIEEALENAEFQESLGNLSLPDQDEEDLEDFSEEEDLEDEEEMEEDE